MAVLWTYPPVGSGISSGAGGAVTAAALTAGTPAPPPVLPPIPFTGVRLTIKAHLEMTSTSATPTLVMGFYLGAVGGAIASATVLGVTAAQTLSASASSWPIILEWEGTFRNVGTAVTMHGCGNQWVSSAINTWAAFGVGTGPAPFPATAAARTTAATLNTEINQQLDVGITLSSTTGSPSITVTELHARLDG